jgi:hypothetical protein
VRAWGVLGSERRLAAVAAIAMFLTMFLPWYSKTNTFVVNGQTRPGEVSLTAFQAFSWVEAAVLLIAAGVLYLLFVRAEGRPFHLPGGDGTIILAAGAWSGILVFYRLLDKPGTTATARLTSTVGVKWGVFLALLAAILLGYAGARLRAARRPEPPLERKRPRREQPAGEDLTVAVASAEASPGHGAPVPARRRPRYPPAPSGTGSPRSGRAGPPEDSGGEQLSFDEHPAGQPPSGEELSG